MRAMILQQVAPISDSPLELREVPDPKPGEGQVRVRVRCCGICRTDLHVIEGELPRPTLPLIPGHQIVGTVDAVGPGCERLQKGQRRLSLCPFWLSILPTQELSIMSELLFMY